MKQQYPHLRLGDPDFTIPYTSKSAPIESEKPKRDRKSHGDYIQGKLQEAWNESDNEFAACHSERCGVYLEFQSSPGFELAIKSLENLSNGIRLCNVREKQVDSKKIEYATVYIPNENRSFFFNKVEKYLTEESRFDRPKSADLVESIAELRKALLIESFWTDDTSLIPDDNPQWCEVWLRGDTDDVLGRFEALLEKQKVNSRPGFLRFPERTVKLIKVTSDELQNITRFSDDIAEYRAAKETAHFFINESPADQARWVNELLGRLTVNNESQVSVCILDTGVNNGHPLLQPVLDENDCQSVITEWGSHDHDKHGTLMAGLAAFGDLQEKLESSESVHINHRLESVKILPPNGENEKELWGSITKQAVSIAEIENPAKKRIVCSAVTSNDTRDKGRPSSWSGAIDAITSGAEDGEKRLILISTGNCETNHTDFSNYPFTQLDESIHDPGQSWNAITVGACTQLDRLKDPTYTDYTVIAQRDELSPFSTTSRSWEDKWPIKPEVVFEGGNAAVSTSGFVTQCDDLSLISTYYKPQEKLFEAFDMTSAATAQAAYFAAQIQVAYPYYWPETVRALMIHSARWPVAIKNQFIENDRSKEEKGRLLRICGYGVPDLERALYCANDSLTLIAENEIQPYEEKVVIKDNKKRKDYTSKDMHLYELPWPKEILENLGELEVEMRITLSYFVEPGPGEVGWRDRYRYASSLLRFDINSPTESMDEFIRRVNVAMRNEENGKPDTSSASKYWDIGSNARDKGSIHSDIWRGTAAELAESNKIAVFPKIGWWKERKHLGQYNRKTRYSLIVSIHTPEQDVDIYTPVANMIAQKIEIDT
jgi:hypothetical protein